MCSREAVGREPRTAVKCTLELVDAIWICNDDYDSQKKSPEDFSRVGTVGMSGYTGVKRSSCSLRGLNFIRLVSFHSPERIPT